MDNKIVNRYKFEILTPLKNETIKYQKFSNKKIVYHSFVGVKFHHCDFVNLECCVTGATPQFLGCEFYDCTFKNLMTGIEEPEHVCFQECKFKKTYFDGDKDISKSDATINHKLLYAYFIDSSISGLSFNVKFVSEAWFLNCDFNNAINSLCLLNDVNGRFIFQKCKNLSRHFGVNIGDSDLLPKNIYLTFNNNEKNNDFINAFKKLHNIKIEET